ncbi:MAG TPA: hypothetical protein VMW19_21140 [Myxococcota bacterium]|nr:hypothetical protein [Myxococcota bacterium]
MLVLENASLLDAESGRLLPQWHVVIEGERIAAVEETPVGVSGARRIDLRGRTPMPGLIDAHVHVGAYTLGPNARDLLQDRRARPQARLPRSQRPQDEGIRSATVVNARILRH